MRVIQILLASLVLGFELSPDCLQTPQEVDTYFDSVLLTCQSCPSNQVATEDGLGCTCAPGAAKTEATRDLPSFECESCSPRVASSDSYICQSCPGTVDSETQDCLCDYSSYEIIQEFNEDGSYRETKACVACTDQSYFLGPGSHECVPCPHPGMVRDPDDNYKCKCGVDYRQSGNTCILPNEITEIESQFPEENARTVNYYSMESKDGIGSYSLSASATFDYYYLQAARNCSTYQDILGCQVLGNLCVLQLYNEESTVCRLFKDTARTRPLANPEVTDEGWKQGMPWLYYERNGDQVLEQNRVQMQTTFGENEENRINLLNFYVAKFSLDGRFLGYESFTDQLILCPHSAEDAQRYREFGTNVLYDCSIDLKPYVTSEETQFYELFLEDSDGTLLDVPVLIENFRDASGADPNTGSQENSWKLVRRFYIYDNVSGKEGNNAYEDGKTTKVLSYPVSVKLRVELMTDEDAKIYIPLLMINYRQRLVSYIEEDGPEDNIDFVSEYTMDTDEFWQAATGIFIGVNILTFFIWITKIYVWSKNNPSTYSSQTYTLWILGKAGIMLLGTWAFMLFWYLFFMTGYWFVFYKMQYHVYILIPPTNTYQTNYYPFEVVLGLVIAFQLLWVFDIIRSQSNIDILFIDWETPNRILKPGSDQVKAVMDEIEGHNPNNFYKFSVSAWRTLFVANELNELQSTRYVSIEFTLLFMLFFLVGLGWEQLATAQPNLEVSEEDTSSPRNPVLRFFLTSFLILIIGYTQVVLKKIFSIWFPTPAANFVDLCSVSNISVFILDQSLHGYYIHGVAPTGAADVSIDELLKALLQEETGRARPRGILPEDQTGLQTYEVYLPWKMRQTYDNLGSNPVEEEVNAYVTNKKLGQASKMWFQKPALPREIDFDSLFNVRNELNKRFKTYISTVIMDAKSHICDKNPLQRFLNMPPTDMSLLEGSPFFYRDPAMNFESIFLMGREFSVLLMDLLVFALFDLTTENTLLAAFLTYIFSKLVTYARQKLGERNLSRKTLVDKRFLL